MKKLLLLACLMATATCLLAQNGPTMGWSSWNTYGVNINESLIKCDSFALVGDFNYTPKEEMFGRFENTQMLNTLDDEITATTVNGHDFDNIILPNGMEYNGLRIIDTGHSDHYMLVSDISIPLK